VTVGWVSVVVSLLALLLPASFTGSVRVLELDVDDEHLTVSERLRVPIDSPDGPLKEVWDRHEVLNAWGATYRFARIVCDDQEHRA